MTASVPCGNCDVVRLAAPAVTATVPRVTVLPKAPPVVVKVTLPPVAPATVAVRVTGCPAVAAGGVAVTVVVLAVVPAGASTATDADPLLAPRAASPLKVAVTASVPCCNCEVVSVAVPAVTATVPRVTVLPGVPPVLVKVTLPPVAPGIVAVSVVGWPKVAGLGAAVTVVVLAVVPGPLTVTVVAGLVTFALSVTGCPAAAVAGVGVIVVAVGVVPVGAVTVTVTAPVLAPNVELPLKVAVTTSAPTGNADVLSDAWLLPGKMATVPRVVVPCENVTRPPKFDPVGTVAPFTVAVSSTDWPKVAGFGVAVTVVAEATALTVTTALPALAALSLSPL